MNLSMLVTNDHTTRAVQRLQRHWEDTWGVLGAAVVFVL